MCWGSFENTENMFVRGSIWRKEIFADPRGTILRFSHRGLAPLDFRPVMCCIYFHCTMMKHY